MNWNFLKFWMPSNVGQKCETKFLFHNFLFILKTFKTSKDQIYFGFRTFELFKYFQ